MLCPENIRSESITIGKRDPLCAVRVRSFKKPERRTRHFPTIAPLIPVIENVLESFFSEGRRYVRNPVRLRFYQFHVHLSSTKSEFRPPGFELPGSSRWFSCPLCSGSP